VKTAFGRLGVAMLLVSFGFSAYGQGLPPGSYQQSCRDFRMQGSTLTAVCRRSHGRGEQLTALNITRCVGDIGNNNGHLICNGGQPAAPPPPAPAYAGPGYSPGPGYPGRDMARRRATAKTTARDARDCGMRSTSSATGSLIFPTAGSGSSCSTAWAGSRLNGSSAGAADFPQIRRVKRTIE